MPVGAVDLARLKDEWKIPYIILKQNLSLVSSPIDSRVKTFTKIARRKNGTIKTNEVYLYTYPNKEPLGVDSEGRLTLEVCICMLEIERWFVCRFAYVFF